MHSYGYNSLSTTRFMRGLAVNLSIAKKTFRTICIRVRNLQGYLGSQLSGNGSFILKSMFKYLNLILDSMACEVFFNVDIAVLL